MSFKMESITDEIPVAPYYMDSLTVIFNEDCRKILPWVGKVDLVLTDMPYGEVNRKSGGLRNLDKKDADHETLHPHTLIDVIEANIGGSIYVWCGTEQVSCLRSRLVHYGLTTRVCVWEKTNPSPMNGQHIWLSGVELCVFGRKSKSPFNEHCKSPVFRYPSARSKVHPTEKPVSLFSHLIEVSSNSGGLVLDPFMGSGTALVAAKRLGRKSIGIEINERYCEAAVKRIVAEKT